MYEARCVISSKQLPPAVYSSFKRAVHALDGQTVHILIEKAVAPRSLAQGRRHFGPMCDLIKRIFFDQGDIISKDEAANYIKDHILKLSLKELHGPDGGVVYKRQSSKDWTKEQMMDYMTAVEAFCSQWGYTL
jgi:hypothetical protein